MTGHARPSRAARWYEVDFFTAGPPKDAFSTQVQATSVSDAADKARANFPYAADWSLRIKLLGPA